jgi:hypothetical protein
MMELSTDDVGQLNLKGYNLEDFAVIDKQGARLRNVDGYCYFYSQTEKKCKVYKNRPLGCHIYPVIYVTNERVSMIDELCPMAKTVSTKELLSKGEILDKLLKKIDHEILDLDPLTYTLV